METPRSPLPKIRCRYFLALLLSLIALPVHAQVMEVLEAVKTIYEVYEIVHKVTSSENKVEIKSIQSTIPGADMYVGSERDYVVLVTVDFGVLDNPGKNGGDHFYDGLLEIQLLINGNEELGAYERIVTYLGDKPKDTTLASTLSYVKDKGWLGTESLVTYRFVFHLEGSTVGSANVNVKVDLWGAEAGKLWGKKFVHKDMEGGLESYNVRNPLQFSISPSPLPNLGHGEIKHMNLDVTNLSPRPGYCISADLTNVHVRKAIWPATSSVPTTSIVTGAVQTDGGPPHPTNPVKQVTEQGLVFIPNVILRYGSWRDKDATPRASFDCTDTGGKTATVKDTTIETPKEVFERATTVVRNGGSTPLTGGLKKSAQGAAGSSFYLPVRDATVTITDDSTGVTQSWKSDSNGVAFISGIFGPTATVQITHPPYFFPLRWDSVSVHQLALGALDTAILTPRRAPFITGNLVDDQGAPVFAHVYARHDSTVSYLGSVAGNFRLGAHDLVDFGLPNAEFHFVANPPPSRNFYVNEVIMLRDTDVDSISFGQLVFQLKPMSTRDSIFFSGQFFRAVNDSVIVPVSGLQMVTSDTTTGVVNAMFTTGPQGNFSGMVPRGTWRVTLLNISAVVPGTEVDTTGQVITFGQGSDSLNIGPQILSLVPTVSATGVGSSTPVPRSWVLEQNYPNPFNPSTVIRYTLIRSSHVLLEVFNTLGEKVAVLADADQPAGSHELTFDGNKFASGVYFYRLHARPTDGGLAGEFVQTRKLVLLR